MLHSVAERFTMPHPVPRDCVTQSTAKRATIKDKRLTVGAYVLITYGITLLAVVTGTQTNNQILLALSQATPAFMALLLCTALPNRKLNFSQFGLHRLGGWRWYVLAFSLPAVPIALGYLGAVALGFVAFQWPQTSGEWQALLFRYTVGYVVATFVGPFVWALGEETGWRGFLQSKLVGSVGARAGVLLTGLAWAVWHYIFIFWGGYYEGGSLWLNTGLFTLTVVPMAVVIGWVRLRSASLWPVVIFHAASNATWQVWNYSVTPLDPRWIYVAGEAGIVNIVVWVVFAWLVWNKLLK